MEMIRNFKHKKNTEHHRSMDSTHVAAPSRPLKSILKKEGQGSQLSIILALFETQPCTILAHRTADTLIVNQPKK